MNLTSSRVPASDYNVEIFQIYFKIRNEKKIYEAMIINDNVLLIVPFPQAINHGK